MIWFSWRIITLASAVLVARHVAYWTTHVSLPNLISFSTFSRAQKHPPQPPSSPSATLAPPSQAPAATPASAMPLTTSSCRSNARLGRGSSCRQNHLLHVMVCICKKVLQHELCCKKFCNITLVAKGFLQSISKISATRPLLRKLAATRPLLQKINK